MDASPACELGLPGWPGCSATSVSPPLRRRDCSDGGHHYAISTEGDRIFSPPPPSQHRQCDGNFRGCQRGPTDADSPHQSGPGTKESPDSPWQCSSIVPFEKYPCVTYHAPLGKRTARFYVDAFDKVIVERAMHVCMHACTRTSLSTRSHTFLTYGKEAFRAMGAWMCWKKMIKYLETVFNTYTSTSTKVFCL